MALLDLQSRLAKGLATNKQATAYLRDRSISGFTADDLGMGYCDFNTFQEAGVDFNGRITFPISNLHGDIVGFGGRSITASPQKYMNSPASDAYDKSRTLYNLHQAQDFILESGIAVIVEGYFDVAMLWQVGVRNVVATCGTSLTRWHLRLLKRFSDRAVLLFDGDAAGEKSASRVAASLGQEKHPVLLAEVPFGMDPDEWAKMYGMDGILDLINDAKEAKIN